MRKLFSLLFMVTMLVSPLFAHAPKQLSATHRIEMTSVVPDPESGEKRTFICSATAIGPHALLTAAHCDTSDIFMKIDGQDVVFIKDRIVDNQDHEIFIVNTTFNQVAEFERADALKKGDDVWVEGNAAGFYQLIRRGTFSGIVQADGQTFTLYDFNGYFGDSGSAVFDDHGKIVDVVNVIFPFPYGFKMMGSRPMKFSAAQLEKAAKE